MKTAFEEYLSDYEETLMACALEQGELTGDLYDLTSEDSVDLQGEGACVMQAAPRCRPRIWSCLRSHTLSQQLLQLLPLPYILRLPQR